MEFYRFPPAHPRRLFLAVIAFVAVVLALPTIVQAALADSSADVEQVTLTEPSQDWEIDVPDPLSTQVLARDRHAQVASTLA